eukprot:gene7830-biopygen2594
MIGVRLFRECVCDLNPNPNPTVVAPDGGMSKIWSLRHHIYGKGGRQQRSQQRSSCKGNNPNRFPVITFGGVEEWDKPILLQLRRSKMDSVIYVKPAEGKPRRQCGRIEANDYHDEENMRFLHFSVEYYFVAPQWTKFYNKASKHVDSIALIILFELLVKAGSVSRAGGRGCSTPFKVSGRQRCRKHQGIIKETIYRSSISRSRLMLLSFINSTITVMKEGVCDGIAGIEAADPTLRTLHQKLDTVIVE